MYGIVEGFTRSFAYILKDARGVVTAVRNNDELLSTWYHDDENNLPGYHLFSRANDESPKEIPLNQFNALFQNTISDQELLSWLNADTKAWTWKGQRVCGKSRDKCHRRRSARGDSIARLTS